MKETLNTDEVYFEVTKLASGTHILNLYHKHDDDLFIEACLSDREMRALIKMLTRVNIGLKSY